VTKETEDTDGEGAEDLAIDIWRGSLLSARRKPWVGFGVNPT
jgi:hypothetical protein